MTKRNGGSLGSPNILGLGVSKNTMVFAWALIKTKGYQNLSVETAPFSVNIRTISMNTINAIGLTLIIKRMLDQIQSQVR